MKTKWKNLQYLEEVIGQNRWTLNLCFCKEFNRNCGEEGECLARYAVFPDSQQNNVPAVRRL